MPELARFPSKKLPKGTFEVIKQGKFEDKYIMGASLGKGSFGTVNLCKLVENYEVVRAVKRIRKS